MIGLLDSLGVHPALILFLIFALVVIAYGLVIWKTGNKDWLPLRVQPSVSTEEDVRAVGRATTGTGGVMLVIVGLFIVVSLMTQST